ncbi:MAG TPA: PAS domain S-box protein [Flavobacteriales bacterium]
MEASPLPTARLLLRPDRSGNGGSWQLAYANRAWQRQHLGVVDTGEAVQGSPGLLEVITRAAREQRPVWWDPEDGPAHQVVPLAADEVVVIAQEERPQVAAALRQLLDVAPYAMLILDEQQVVRGANEQAAHLFGRQRAMLAGLPVSALINGELPLSAGSSDVEGRRKDGTVFALEVMVGPWSTPQGPHIALGLRDITMRKNVEAGLREGEERMRRIVDTAYDAFIAMDDQGRITAWNTKAEAMFGLPRAQALGRDLADTIIPPAQRAAHREGLRRFLTTGQAPLLNKRLEITAERFDGTPFPAEMTITALKHANTFSFNAFVADITERKTGELLFRDLLEAAPDAMVIVDRAGFIRLVNAGTEELFGHSRDTLIGRNVEVLVPEQHRADTAPLFTRLFNDSSAGVHARTTEFHGLHQHGREFPVEISLGRLQTPDGIWISAAIRDISERRKAEQEIRDLNRNLEQRVQERTDALLRSEERFSEAMAGMLEGVQVIDNDWRYTYANEALVKQSGYRREELLGRTMMELYPGIEHSDMFAQLRASRATGQPRLFENHFTFPDGSEGVYELSVRPVHDSLFVLSSDITARKRAEQEVVQQSERLMRQNQELEQFAYIASHDLQEPLRMVTSYVELLQRRYAGKLDADANEFIGFAVDGTKRMKQLIQDLLMFSRVGRTMTFTPVKLDDVLDEVQRNLRVRMGETGAVITRGYLPTVTGTHTALVQLFQNLISNAIKFRRPEEAPLIHVQAQDTGAQWAVSVQDNGIGMDMQYADQVFMPFKRLHGSDTYSGTGIGLAVVKKAVELHKGRIHFTSETGRGTTFVFTLSKNIH